MDKKIVIPFGFALMLTMAVIGALALFNLTAISPAEASIKDTVKNTRVNLDPLKASGTPATVTVSGTPVTVNPNDPGALARYEVRFTTGAVLLNGVDTIILTFEDDFQVPPSIDRTSVSVSATAVTGAAGNPGASVNPIAVTVDFVGPENDEPEITITVPDMDPDDNTGGNGIAANAVVTLIFPQSAGLRNPTEGSGGENAGGYDVSIATSVEPAPATARVLIPFIVELSSAADPRNTEVTLVGKGFRNATTTTFWRDTNGDGQRGGGELDLCSAVATDEDVATCSFRVTNPPFAPGTGGDCTLGALTNCNYINAVDGRNNNSTQVNQADIDRQTYELEGLVTVAPAAGDPGDTVTVQLKDFATGNLTAVTVGGVAVMQTEAGSAVNALSVPASGELNFTIEIPDGVPEGVQAVAVTGPAVEGNQTERADLNVGGATLIPTPETVMPNQRVTLIGTGFTEGGAATINDPNDPDDSIAIGGEVIAQERINDGDVINVDNGGNWSASIDLPITSATTTGGPRELKVTDSSGRQGTAVLTFPERQLTITPEEGRVGTNITVRGLGFPARNDDGSSVTVEVIYDAGAGDVNRTTVTPDASGNFNAALRVPNDAGIPSTNTVEASFTEGALETITTTVHRVPRATITIEPTSGEPGTMVTVDAVGFERFSPIQIVEIGGTEVTPAPKPATDASGNVTFDVIVPGLETGTQTVEMQVAGTTASAGFTITETGEATGAPTQVAQAIEPLGDNLVRAFHFNNTTKEWNFFDPRPAFSEASNLEQFVEGQPYWVRVTENQTVELNGESRTLTCINAGTPQEDCWNLIVW
jgi:hypothetical protein